MEKDSFAVGTIPSTVDPPVMIPIAVIALVTVPPTITANVHATTAASVVSMLNPFLHTTYIGSYLCQSSIVKDFFFNVNINMVHQTIRLCLFDTISRVLFGEIDNR